MNRDRVAWRSVAASMWERLMAKRPKRTDDEEIERLIRAARIFSGDAEDDAEPMSDEESAIVEELRAEQPRPSPEEIKAFAAKLLKRRE